MGREGEWGEGGGKKMVGRTHFPVLSLQEVWSMC